MDRDIGRWLIKVTSNAGVTPPAGCNQKLAKDMANIGTPAPNNRNVEKHGFEFYR